METIQQNSNISNYDEDEKYSHSKEDFWQAVYEKAFPEFDSMMDIRKEKYQHKGIDRIVNLKNGKSIAVDEKLPRKWYNTLLLEYISNDNNLSCDNGWINKDLDIDYLVFGFTTIGRAYFLDWKALKKVWNIYGEEWKIYGKNKQYGMSITIAKNKKEDEEYNTYCVAIPIDTLQKYMGGNMIGIQLKKEENAMTNKELQHTTFEVSDARKKGGVKTMTQDELFAYEYKWMKQEEVYMYYLGLQAGGQLQHAARAKKELKKLNDIEREGGYRLTI